MECYRQRHIYTLFQVILFIADCSADNLIFNVNFKKPIAVTSESFLSLNVDPATFFNTDAMTKNIERSTNMARGLAPAYVRIGRAPRSNSRIYQRAYLRNADIDPNDVVFDPKRSLVSGWEAIQQWAKNAGLDVIACIAPRYIETDSQTHLWNPTKALNFLSFSNHMGYNASWQLGYECQTRCNLSGEELGRYVANFREILKTFPRYSNSLITGPDIVAYKTAQQQQYLRDYINSAGAALSAITWHPDFASITLNNGNISVHRDNMAVEKSEMYKIIGRAAEKKPLWIAESKPEEWKQRYLGALVWTKRLGDAAKLGVQVIMRQPTNLDKATPDYWVSLLHKALVGREVLEMKTQFDNENLMHFYSQCAKPSAMYERGAVTIFGMNLTPTNATIYLKGFKNKTLHKYILSPGSEASNKILSEKVLLNGKPLDLINDKELPELNPEIITDSRDLELNLSSGDIGFWVIPDVKIKACAYYEEEIIENAATKKLSKRHGGIVRHSDQEKKKDVTQSDLESRTYHPRQEKRRKKNTENEKNEKTENQQRFWRIKLLANLRKAFRKGQRQKEKSDASNLKGSTYARSEEKESLPETYQEMDRQQNLGNDNLEETEKTKGKVETNENIRHILKKYKRTLVKKNDEEKYDEDLKLKADSINKATVLLSKIDALFQNDEAKIMANKSVINDTKLERGNVENRAVEVSESLNNGCDRSENSAEKDNGVTENIEKSFNVLYDLLEDNGLAKDTNEISIKDSRLRRDLSKKLEDLRKSNVHEKHSWLDDLKDRIAKWRANWNKDNRKEISLISSNLKNFNNEGGNFYSLFRGGPVKRFLKEGTPAQISARTRRDVGKRLSEIGLRKDINILRKHSRIDDAKDVINEKMIKRKEDPRKELSLTPFNSKNADSSENNFYGFYRQDPIKGFPEGDIFVAAGDSVEQSGEDYDYIQEDGDESRKEDTQKGQTTRVEDDTWVEIDSDHRDYIPNEFFESVKLPDTRTNGGLKNYGELSEAEVFHGNRENEEDNNRNETTVTEVIREQPPDEAEEKRAREASMQKLVNYYDDSEEENRERNRKYEMLEFGLARSPAVSGQFLKSMRHAEIDLGKQPGPGSFYQPVAISAARYNYGSYQAPSIRRDRLTEEKHSGIMRLNRNDISIKGARVTTPTIADAVVPIQDRIFFHRRFKRSNWKDLQKEELAKEMIKENEDNMKDCHCRVIRALRLPKKLCYCRTKRHGHASTDKFEGILTSTENAFKKTGTASRRSKRDIEYPKTKEEFEKILTGEILPDLSAVEIEADDDEQPDTIAKTVENAESNRLHHRSINETPIREPATSAMNSEESNTHTLFVTSSSADDINDNDIHRPTEETFFRTHSDVSEGKTYDLTETFFEISSSTTEDPFISATKDNALKTTRIEREDRQNLDEKAGADDSTYTTAEDKENEEWHDNNYKAGLNPTDIISDDEETTKRSIEKQITTEATVSKRAIGKSTNFSKSNESKIKAKLQRNTEDNQNARSKLETRAQMKKDNDVKRAKAILQNLPKTPLKELARYEEYLKRRAEQIEKRKEKLYSRRDKLLGQYREELSKITDEQKRNLKRREAWERFRESDDFRRLIDEGSFPRILIDDDVMRENEENYDDDEEDCEGRYVSMEFVPRQYDNPQSRLPMPHFDPRQLTSKLTGSLGLKQEDRTDNIKPYYVDEENWDIPRLLRYHQMFRDNPKNNIYSLPQTKYLQNSKVSYPDEDYYYQLLRQSKITGDEQESPEMLQSSARKVFAIDPSTYRGGEPILQVHEDYSEPPEYLSKFKYQGQSPRWSLNDLYRAYSRPQLEVQPLANAQQRTSNQYDNYYHSMKTPIARDRYDEGNADILYVLDAQRQYDLPKEFARLSPVWPVLFDRRDINQSVNNEARELNGFQENIDVKYSDPQTAAKKEKEDTSNVETTKDAKETIDPTILNVKVENESERNNSTLNNKMSTIVEESIDSIKEDEATLLEAMDGRSRRNIEKLTDDKCLKRLPYYVLNRIDSRDKPNRNHYSHSKEDSVEPLNKESTPIFSSIRDTVPFQQPNLKIDRQDEKKFQSSKYVVLVPTMIENIYPLETSEIKYYDDSLENIPKSIQKLINKYSSEEMSDLLTESIKDSTNRDVSYSSSEYSENDENEQKAWMDIEDIEVDYKSREEDEEHRESCEELDKYSEVTDKVQSDEYETFTLQTANKVKRQRRQIKRESFDRESANQLKQEEPYKLILPESTREISEHDLNENNIDKAEISAITSRLSSRIIREKQDADLFKDFAKTQKIRNVQFQQPKDIEAISNNIVLENEFFLKPSYSTPDTIDKLKISANSKNEKNYKGLENISKELPSVVEESIPKLQDVIASTLEKDSQNFTKFMNESFENLKEKFNETLDSDKDTHSKNQTKGATGNIFYDTITNVKKFFMLISGISRVLYA